jgi:phosphate transport system substrate-binding protein
MVEPASARDHMWLVGGYATLPFTKAVAERVAKASGAPAPITESTGTAGGFAYLCDATGAFRPDAVSAARRISRAEFDLCQMGGAGDIVEIPVGLDILVVAQSKAGPVRRLTLAEMSLALAAQLPNEIGALVPNPHRTWSEAGPELPSVAIDVRVLPEVTGAREAWEELFLQSGARNVPRIAKLIAKGGLVSKAMRTVREDRPFVTVHDSEEEIASELSAHPNALGILSYRTFYAHRANLRGLVIEGVEPTYENASAGKYVGTRKLYLYVRKSQLGVVPGLDRLGAEHVSSAALGPNGYLLAQGFAPLGMDDMLKTMALLEEMPALRRDALAQ